MLVGWMKSIIRGIYLTAAIVASLFILAFSIDAVEIAHNGGLVTAATEGGLKKYSAKISAYSLVNLGVLVVEADGKFAQIDAAPLLSCIGHLRHVAKNSYVDVTALTVGVIGVETYNRNSFRRAAEIYAQDVVRMFGGKADYTIGIGQIKSSLAEKIYRSKINEFAKPDEIKSFARDDCGGARLAALLVQQLLSECGVENSDLNSKELILCVTQKYTGMKNTSREYAIYTSAVGSSYTELFDQANDFYYAYLADKMKIDTIQSGECVTFNVGKSELAAIPKDESARVNDSLPPTVGVPSNLIIGDARIEYMKPPQSNRTNIIKIIVPDTDRLLNGQADSSLSKARQELIIKYACERYLPLAVEFFSRPDFPPNRFSKYCLSANSDNELSLESYVLLNTGGTLAAKDVRSVLCSETSAGPG